jgi:hypothetical protein
MDRLQNRCRDIGNLLWHPHLQGQHPTDLSQKRLLLSGLILVIIGVSAFAFGIHWSIVSGNVKNTVLLFGGSLFIQGLTSILGMEASAS